MLNFCSALLPEAVSFQIGSDHFSPFENVAKPLHFLHSFRCVGPSQAHFAMRWTDLHAHTMFPWVFRLLLNPGSCLAQCAHVIVFSSIVSAFFPSKVTLGVPCNACG